MRSVGGRSVIAAAAVSPLGTTAAQAAEAVPAVMAYGAVGTLALIGLALGVLALIQARRLSVSREETRVARREAEFREAVLASASDAWIAWPSPIADPIASPGLGAALGLGADRPASFDDLLDRLADEARTRLFDTVGALRAEGCPIAERLTLDDLRRILLVRGEKAGAGAVLWLQDVTERTAEVGRLTLERDRLRAALDLLPIAVWIRDPGLAIAFANRAYARAVDSDPDVGTPATAEIAAGVIDSAGRALAAAAQRDGAPHGGRYHLVMGGQRRLAEIAEAPVGGDGAVAGYAIDRTDVEEAQAELARHVAGHEEVLHSLSSPFAIYGPDQRLQFFNAAFVRLWQVEEYWLRTHPTMDEMLDALRERRRLPEHVDFRAFKEERRRLFTSLISTYEELVQLPDETTLRTIISPHPFGGLMFVWEDVTDKLALERSYNTLIAVQRETLDHLFEGVAVIGGDGRLRLYNPAFVRIWQMVPENLLNGPHMNELIVAMRPFFATDAEWESVRDDMLALHAEREPVNGRLERSDGTVLDYGSVPLPDGAVLLSFMDVSDSIRVERALRERTEALETADQLKSEFIANVSYELRTPLNTIIGFAEILTDQYFGVLNARQTEYSRGILESSQRLLSLINDILDLASIEAGHMALDLDSVDLHALLGGVLSLIRERARSKKLAVEFDCPTDIGTVVADERRLKQAIFNILNNAVKFTHEGGNLRITVRRVDDEVVLTFADTGIGIPTPDQERVFGRFERGSSPEARNSGAGLGLSLVKSFIELHGGRVDLESEEGVGTRVTCRLPSRQAEPPVRLQGSAR